MQGKKSKDKKKKKKRRAVYSPEVIIFSSLRCKVMINYCSHWGSRPPSWGATLLWDVFRSVFLSKWITDPMMSPVEVSTNRCCSLAVGFICDIYPGLTLKNFSQKHLNWIYSNHCKAIVFLFQNWFSKLVLSFFGNHKIACLMFHFIYLFIYLLF